MSGGVTASPRGITTGIDAASGTSAAAGGTYGRVHTIAPGGSSGSLEAAGGGAALNTSGVINRSGIANVSGDALN